MKVYIAGPYPLRDAAIALMHALEAEGFEVTSTWLREIDILAHEHAMVDLHDVARADVLVALNPAGWEEKGTGGRHAEFGYALALNKRIVLIGERSHIFHYLNHLVVIAEQANVAAALRAVARQDQP